MQMQSNETKPFQPLQYKGKELSPMFTIAMVTVIIAALALITSVF